MMDPLQAMSADFTTWISPLLAVSLALVFGITLRDWAMNLVLGMKFKIDQAWYEGAHCFIDNDLPDPKWTRRGLAPRLKREN